MANNIENLKPLSTEKAREIGRKGGIASGKAKKQRKNMKEALNMLLSLDVKSSKAREQLRQLGIEDEDMTNEMAMMVAMFTKAMKGDRGCAEFIRDTSGQKPKENLNIDFEKSQAEAQELLANIKDMMKDDNKTK